MQYIDIHTHLPSSSTKKSIINIQITESQQTIPNDIEISIGIHPWNTTDISSNTLNFLLQQASNLNVLALGECGIDRLKGANIDIQKEIFIYQAKLANNINKPLIIHCVKAFPEIISIYKKLKPDNPWIIHGFNQNKQITEELIKHRIYLSFGSSLLNNSSNASKIFSKIPKEYIFVETDESNIDIKEIYTKAAELRNISLIELSKIINSNYKRCFKYE